MTDKEKAAVCLMCTKPECTGEVACFREMAKERHNRYQRERRQAERAREYVCNIEETKKVNKARNMLKKVPNKEVISCGE